MLAEPKLSVLSEETEEDNFNTFKTKYLSETRPMLVWSSQDKNRKIELAMEYTCSKIAFADIRCAYRYERDMQESEVLYDSIGVTEKISHPNTVVMIRPFSQEEEVIAVPSSMLEDGDEMYHWVASRAYPAFIESNDQNTQLLFSSKRPGYRQHIIFFVDSSGDNYNTIMDTARSIAVQEEFVGNPNPNL